MRAIIAIGLAAAALGGGLLYATGPAGAPPVTSTLAPEAPPPEAPPPEAPPPELDADGAPILRPSRPEFIRCRESTDMACMTWLPGGKFLRGAQSADPNAPGYDPAAADDEGPVREVELDGFWIHVAEVPVVYFDACVALGGCRPEDSERRGGRFNLGRADRVEFQANGVSWAGARDYCAWIDARLPTEAEWEYAARGTDGRRWPWGNEPASCEHTHMGLGGEGCGSGVSLSFGRGKPSSFGLLQMAGGVWEWTADWYAPDAYAAAPAKNPTGPADGTERVQRGGGWTDADPNDLRSAARAHLPPGQQLDDVGFRCVRSTPAGP